MFGNKFGWGVSAAIVVVVFGLIMLLDMSLSNLTPPTSFAKNPDVMSVIALPTGPATLVSMTKPGDAGPLYRQAMSVFPSDKEKAVSLIVEAAPLATANIFLSKPDEVIGYDLEREPFASLCLAGKTTNQRGLAAYKAKNYDEATKYFEAAFSLGTKLYQERLSNWEFREGMYILGDAAQGLQYVAKAKGDTARSAQFEKFLVDNRDYYKKSLEPMLRIITTIDLKVMTQSVGDVFEVARRHPDRMWRVEALLKLGRYRFNIGDNQAADQRFALKYLKTAAEDSDPAIRTAAIAGRDLTELQYRVLK